MPFECRLFSGPDAPEHCVLAGIDEAREIEHIADGHMGFHIIVRSVAEDGTVTFEIGEGTLPEPSEDAGTPASDAGSDENDAGTTSPADAGDGGDEPTCGCASVDGADASSATGWLAMLSLLLFTRSRRKK